VYILRGQAEGVLEVVAKHGLARLCYACGICVGDCPAARFSDDFNPRQIFLKVSLGVADGLVEADSPIWKCTTCYTCAERCPAGVKPVEVIIALRNISYAKGSAPPQVEQVRQAIASRGIVSGLTDTILKRRKQMGLPDIDEKLGQIVRGIIGGNQHEEL